jgi:hypothetical protein
MRFSDRGRVNRQSFRAKAYAACLAHGGREHPDESRWHPLSGRAVTGACIVPTPGYRRARRDARRTGFVDIGWPGMAPPVIIKSS